jgi:anthranilate synthase/aminodeoxychorismate synthase-like glutamine amidotransferase
MKVLLIDNYDSFTYNLFHYLSSLKCKVDVQRNDKIGIDKIKSNKYQKIVISPGPGNPNQAGNCLKIVKYFHKKIPILGVCLGHQIIGQVFNCKIIRAKKLMHGKTSVIKHSGQGIFKGIKKTITATRYHSLVVDNKNFSNKLIITAQTKDKVIMGIMHKKYNIHGVQFHPESIKTVMGLKILKNFINYKSI